MIKEMCCLVQDNFSAVNRKNRPEFSFQEYQIAFGDEAF